MFVNHSWIQCLNVFVFCCILTYSSNFFEALQMEYSYLPVAGSTVAFHETCALVVISVSIYGLAVTISQSFHRDGERRARKPSGGTCLIFFDGFTWFYYIILCHYIIYICSAFRITSSVLCPPTQVTSAQANTTMVSTRPCG